MAARRSVATVGPFRSRTGPGLGPWRYDLDPYGPFDASLPVTHQGDATVLPTNEADAADDLVRWEAVELVYGDPGFQALRVGNGR